MAEKKAVKLGWASRAKRLMMDKGITQGDLAPVLGKSTRGAVGHYFTGRTQPTLEQFESMADYFDVTLCYLLSGDENSLRIHSGKLQNCILEIANAANQHDLDISEEQKAKLIAFLYKETSNNEEVSKDRASALVNLVAE
jgi:transcriptional regulator with XRE-family HTH domain